MVQGYLLDIEGISKLLDINLMIKHTK
jgi:hypothetical protein